MSDTPRRVFIAIPSDLDAVKVNTMVCILDGVLEAFAANILCCIKGYAGIRPISNCRNFALAEFLASECDELVFLDDDIVWEKGAFLKLLSYPVDLVMGIYPYRADPLGFPVRFDASKPTLTGDPATGLLAIEGAGFGFVRMTRACAQKMWDAHAHLAYPEKGAPGGNARMLFQLNVMEDGVLWSEDMLFCRRWRKLGGQVWLDPDITFVHIGNKGFAGNLGQFLKQREQRRQTQERAEKALADAEALFAKPAGSSAA